MVKTFLVFPVLLLAGSLAFAKGYLSEKNTEGIRNVVVIHVPWDTKYTVSYQGVTIFGNRHQEVAEDPIDLHGCVSLGVNNALSEVGPKWSYQVLPSAVVRQIAGRVGGYGSSVRGYLKKFMREAAREHPADLYLVFTSWPGGTYMGPNGQGSHGVWGRTRGGRDVPISVFWAVELSDWKSDGHYAGDAVSASNEAVVATMPGRDDFPTFVAQHQTALEDSLRGLIARDAQRMLTAFLTSTKYPRKPDVELPVKALQSCRAGG